MRTGSSFADRLAFLAAKMLKRRKRNQQGTVHHSFVAFVSFCEEAIATVASPVLSTEDNEVNEGRFRVSGHGPAFGRGTTVRRFCFLRLLRLFAANRQLHSARTVVCGLRCCG